MLRPSTAGEGQPRMGIGQETRKRSWQDHQDHGISCPHLTAISEPWTTFGCLKKWEQLQRSDAFYNRLFIWNHVFPTCSFGYSWRSIPPIVAAKLPGSVGFLCKASSRAGSNMGAAGRRRPPRGSWKSLDIPAPKRQDMSLSSLFFHRLRYVLHLDSYCSIYDMT